MSKKRLIFITVIILSIVIMGLYATYATDTTIEETNYDMTLNFDLASGMNKQIKTESGKRKYFDIDLTNSYNQSVKYGITYELVGLTKLPEGVKITTAANSKNNSVDLVSPNSTATITIIVENNSNQEINLNFSVVNGYENGGELIVSNNKNLVPIIDKRIDNSGANYPKLTEGLIPVMYDETRSKWVVASTTSSTSQYGWYNYDNKKWANAVLVNNTLRNNLTRESDGTYTPGQVIGDTESDGVLAFYVWIPRYKYKVWNINKTIGVDAYNAQTTGIDIVFEEGTSTTGNVTCTYDFTKTATDTVRNEECTGTNGESYYTHPAFAFGNDKITGFWMGKFESSSIDQQTLDSGLVILPNMSSLDVGGAIPSYLALKNMQSSSNIYGLSTDISKADSHTITNMEWGAVAYLTHSKYGRCNGGENSACTEVSRNTTTTTGKSTGVPANSNDYSMTSYTYKEVNGQLGSTTGNIYGIYDMSGGRTESVMGNISSTSGSYTYNPYNSNFGTNWEGYTYDSSTTKYLTTYAYGITLEDQIAYNRTRLGDATGEIVSSADNGWYNDLSWVPTGIVDFDPWIIRGGDSGDGDRVGIFYYTSFLDWVPADIGAARAVLIVFK